MSRVRTSGAVVLSYPELVEVSRISNGEFVIIGVDRLLPVLHVDPQLVPALASDPLDVIETCGETTHVTSLSSQILMVNICSLMQRPSSIFQG